MDVEYIYGQGNNCHEFSLLALNSFIGHFVQPVEGKRIEQRVRNGGNRYFSPLRISHNL